MTKAEFNAQVLKQAGSLRTYALHFTHDRDDADDLVQDTLLKAITYYTKFREGTNLKGWLYTIMRNTFINNYRRIVKLNNFVTKSEEIPSSSLIYSASYNQGEAKFVMKDIKDALAALADEYRIPFTMYFEGYKYHEIADHLGIPIGTVKTRIHVARRLLKGRLKSYGKSAGKAVFLND